ncbi:MAG: metallopeptidase family protein [Nitrospirae bacterium]|nr:MAG: metallopeptidase family protein [Nitrospirota bacterium]
MPYKTSRERFEELAGDALRSIPKKFRRKFRNVAIIVEDYPAKNIVEEMQIPRNELMGLFSGRPVGEDGGFFEIPSPYPNTIHLYQKNIEEACSSEADLIVEIRKTMLHEVGHYFGLSENDLDDL